MRAPTLHVLLLLLPLLAPAAAGAQYADVVEGARVRVRAPGVVVGRVTGRVAARTADTLALAIGDGAPRAIPVARITSLEISRGRSHLLGATVGLAWGAVIFLPIGLLAARREFDCGEAGTGCAEPNRDGIVAFSVLAGALGGAFWGAVIGRERWERR